LCNQKSFLIKKQKLACLGICHQTQKTLKKQKLAGRCLDMSHKTRQNLGAMAWFDHFNGPKSMNAAAPHLRLVDPSGMA
jgi:hypothetical protein